MHRQHTIVDSPYGPLTLVATDGVLSGLYMTAQRHRPPERPSATPTRAPSGRRSASSTPTTRAS